MGKATGPRGGSRSAGATRGIRHPATVTTTVTAPNIATALAGDWGNTASGKVWVHAFEGPLTASGWLTLPRCSAPGNLSTDRGWCSGKESDRASPHGAMMPSSIANGTAIAIMAMTAWLCDALHPSLFIRWRDSSASGGEADITDRGQARSAVAVVRPTSSTLPLLGRAAHGRDIMSVPVHTPMYPVPLQGTTVWAPGVPRATAVIGVPTAG